MNLEQIAAPSWAEFNEWMHKELPAGTIIGNPGWWASRIYKRFIAAPPICPTAEWQDIETAPQDGTRILVWPFLGQVDHDAWSATDEHWLPGVTHWMPLPAAPEAKKS